MTSRVEQLLEEILTLLKRREGNQSTYHPPAITTPDLSATQCPRCGLPMTGSTGYICSSPACPLGIGTITSSRRG